MTITISNNFGIIAGAITAVENADHYIIYKNDAELLRLGANTLSFVDVITPSETVHRYKYKAVLGDAETEFSEPAAVFYPARRIIGLYANKTTDYGTAKAFAINLARITNTRLKLIMDSFISLNSIKSGVLRLDEEVKAAATSLEINNKLYGFIQENLYEDHAFIYEDSTGEDNMALRTVNENTNMLIGDETIIFLNAGTFTLLDSDKLNNGKVYIVNYADDGPVVIASEKEGQLINNFTSIKLNKKGNSVLLQAGANQWYILGVN